MTTATPQDFDIRPFDAALGAEVIGLDLNQPLSATDFQRLHRAHLDHHVVVFRDQRITPAQQIDFSRRFGPLQIHVLHQFQLPGHPEILIVSNVVEDGKPIGLGDAGHFWHSDLSYKEKPSLGSLLHARELPEEGGDTLFANMHTAWDALPADLQRRVEGLQLGVAGQIGVLGLQALHPALQVGGQRVPGGVHIGEQRVAALLGQLPRVQ